MREILSRLQVDLLSKLTNDTTVLAKNLRIKLMWRPFGPSFPDGGAGVAMVGGGGAAGGGFSTDTGLVGGATREPV